MGGPPAWGLGDMLTTPHRKTYHYKIFIEILGPELTLWYDLSNEKET
jgi:hypothetical protein